MRVRQYVVPGFDRQKNAPEVDSTLTAVEWADKIAELRARLLLLTEAQRVRYLPRLHITDWMGLVVCQPYSTELQAVFVRMLYPQFLADTFLRRCTQCGERLLTPAMAAEICARVEAQLAFAAEYCATSVQMDELRSLSLQLAASAGTAWLARSRLESSWSLFEPLLSSGSLSGPLGLRMQHLMGEKKWAEIAQWYEEYADPVVSRQSADQAIAGLTGLLAGQTWPWVWDKSTHDVPTSLPTEATSDEDKGAEEESFLTQDEVDSLLAPVSAACAGEDTDATTECVHDPHPTQVSAVHAVTQDDPRQQASFVQNLPDASMRMLLVELEFGIYEDTLANFLWFMKSAELMRKVLRNMTLHHGAWLMERLNTLWFGKNPDNASLKEKQAGQAAVATILKLIRMFLDEGRMAETSPGEAP
ncbi:MAG: hypothetical protein IPH35_18625 [Rhodoferax sp.]|nr:hypothetical protein [Rhodoferax sp.]